MSEKPLDIIINKMTEVVEQSQDDIFHISEQTEKEYIKIKEELEVTKNSVAEYIMRSDELEIQVRQSRKRLSEVSKQFGSHNERQIREVYEKTHTLQTELAIVQSEEKTLRDRRDDLERRLVQLMETIDYARDLGRKVSVISSFLQDDFQEMNAYIKTAHEKEKVVLKIIEAQEQERKRISREIHDGPAQSLANVLVRSEIVDLTFRDGNTQEALKEMKVFRESIRQSLQEVRRIIYDLRPMALDDLGLIPTIKKHISTVSKYNDIDIQFTLHGEEKRLETPYEVALFRLIQEGLQNAIKHAHAKLIKILIEIRKDRVFLIIQDDGVGFDTSEKNKSDSYGIIGMKERIELLEGEFTLTSKMNKGTKIKVMIPFKEIAVESH